MLYYSVTIVVTGQLASWAHHPTQLLSGRRGRCLARLATARQRYFFPKNTDYCVHIQSVRHCGHCWNGHKTNGRGCPVFPPSHQLTALNLGPKRAVWSLLDRLHCFFIYLSVCKTLLGTEVIDFGSSLAGWRQCFSTFVRLQPGKFFFYKTRAQSQLIYS